MVSGLGTSVSGGLLAVDPVSDTAVLVELAGEGDLATQNIVIVPLVNWESLQVLDSSQSMQERVRAVRGETAPRHSLSPSQLASVRAQTVAWLRRNGLPVEVEGEEVVIAGMVRLEPPYSPDSCQADNEIVLNRVSTILRDMPCPDLIL